MKLRLISGIVFLLVLIENSNSSAYCRETLQNQELQQIKWSYLRQCLLVVSGESMSSKMNENIWRLVKLSFESSIDNVPHEAYRLMGYALTAIPLEDFRNISMENVDMIEIFGSIINTMSREYQQGFSEEQLSMLAQKFRSEWLGKTPQTYSEYDLRAMGEILCYFNVTDIENIHTDAFMEAIEWIGLLEKCPEDRLQAFANMARRSDAFGEPNKWSKLEVTIIGNILNGLPTQDINAISKDKLQLNHFYRPHGGIQQQQQHQRGSVGNFTLELNETTKSGEENLGVKNNSN